MVSYACSLSLIEDRRSGIWNRTLIAGATPYQFLISQLIFGSALMFIQAIEFIIYAMFVGNGEDSLSYFLVVSSLVFLIGISGTLFGLLISVITDSVLVATYLSLVLLFPLLSLGGKLSFLGHF